MKKLILNPGIFSDPDRVGQAEYRAIHELLSSTVEEETENGTPEKEIEGLLRGILLEFVQSANVILAEAESKGVLVTDETED